MTHLLPPLRRFLLFAAIGGVASLILPQVGVVIARGSAYERSLNGNWDAASAAAGLLVFGALEVWWGAWLCLTVAGGMVDNNLGRGVVSALTGAALIAVAGIVVATTVLP